MGKHEERVIKKRLKNKEYNTLASWDIAILLDEIDDLREQLTETKKKRKKLDKGKRWYKLNKKKDG